jgi:light-regulated signal transduction histidine kinase (bacteriophytochrome)
MNGFEVARLLRGMDRTRHIPIIFVTATHREEKFTFEGFESGAVDYLFKPLNPVIVRSKVRIFVELHRKSAHLEQAVRNLHLVNQELEAFSYSVSHDLQAPVRSVIGFAQNALENVATKGDEGLCQDIQRVIAAGEQMKRLIQALLELARLSRLELARAPLNLTELALQICEELKQEHPGREIALKIEPGMAADCDKRLLEIVLRNFLGNAFKFTGKEPRAQIEFGSQNHPAEKIYFIRDNGAGFDMAFAERLFGAFQRLHAQDDFAGTGVGLATVQRIVHRHGGRVWAESAVDKGATFYFTLSNQAKLYGP